MNFKQTLVKKYNISPQDAKELMEKARKEVVRDIDRLGWSIVPKFATDEQCYYAYKSFAEYQAHYVRVWAIMTSHGFPEFNFKRLSKKAYLKQEDPAGSFEKFSQF